MTKQNKESKGQKAQKPMKLEVSRGLEGFDDAWHLLTPMFEQLQLVSVETASPTLDVLTFAQSAHFFGVISLVPDVEEPKDGDGDVPDDTDIAFIDETNINYTEERIIAAWGSRHAYESLDRATRHAWEAEEDARELAWRMETNNWIPGSGFPDLETQRLAERVAFAPRPAPAPLRLAHGIIGFTYLTSSQNMEDYLRSQELCIGIFITEQCRNRGYAQQAISKTLEVAFEDQHCHRVQAVLVDSPYKDRALSLFMKSGLGHEGVRRRGFRSPYDYEFKDVTYLGLLATDWFMHNSPGAKKYVLAPKSLWDELFARHQREREELLRWEAKHQQPKRTSSMETIRQVGSSARGVDVDGGDEDMYADEVDEVETDDGQSEAESTSSSRASVISRASASSSAKSSSDRPSPSKRRRTYRFSEEEEEGNARLGPSRTHASLEIDQDFVDNLKSQRIVVNADVDHAAAEPRGMDWLEESTTRNIHRGESPAFSDNSELESDSDGYVTSTSSEWDVVSGRESSSGLSDVEYEALNLSDSDL